MKKKIKRKMPAHIVLPNGMWRFIKGKGKVTKKKTRRVIMARKKSRRSHRRGMSFPGGKWGKILAFAAGASVLGGMVLPQVDDNIRAAVGGFIAGGPIGAAVGYVAGPAVGNIAQGALGGSVTQTSTSRIY